MASRKKGDMGAFWNAMGQAKAHGKTSKAIGKRMKDRQVQIDMDIAGTRSRGKKRGFLSRLFGR